MKDIKDIKGNTLTVKLEEVYSETEHRALLDWFNCNIDPSSVSKLIERINQYSKLFKKLNIAIGYLEMNPYLIYDGGGLSFSRYIMTHKLRTELVRGLFSGDNIVESLCNYFDSSIGILKGFVDEKELNAKEVNEINVKKKAKMKKYTFFIKLEFTTIDSTHKHTDSGFSSVIAVSAENAESAVNDAWEATIQQAKEANKDCKLVKMFLADINTLAIE